MENNTSPGYENLKRSEYEKADHSGQLTDSQTSKPYSQVLSADDLLLEDFLNEETFVLREEYVMMEEEYVMWEGTAPCKLKNRAGSFNDVFEEELVLPEDDNLHHLGGYFNLKTENRSISHY